LTADLKNARDLMQKISPLLVSKLNEQLEYARIQLEDCKKMLYKQERLKFIENIKEIAKKFPSMPLSGIGEDVELGEAQKESLIRELLREGVIKGKYIETSKTLVFERVELAEKDKVKLKQLFGMIKLKGKIDLNKAKEIMNISKDEIEGLIYELVGSNQISGRLEGAVFVVESDVDTFIEFLEKEFSYWDSAEKSKYGKN